MAADGRSLTIAEASTPAHYADARRLFTAYAESLPFDLDFQGFAAELAGLPGAYAPPRGCILLAMRDGEALGCVALRPLEEAGLCEMKRLYVQPAARGTGLGRRLAEAVTERAGTLGYSHMRLDTVAGMTAANRLYGSLGFRVTAPYCHNPLADARFYELTLVGEGEA